MTAAQKLIFAPPKGLTTDLVTYVMMWPIHYQNPRIVAGCIPEWDSRILLCRRAIKPRYGLWTLPAGFMENGETVEAAASRETEEEACAKVKLDGLYCI
ncbi:MAG: hypothetical protein Ct9H300mP13_1850 [Gammaproteobacteria bacterium]|nr:MAG: hypothetical protein Ct9H300mP13_1850 [Gammaproteobacteria bacterium]